MSLSVKDQTDIVLNLVNMGDFNLSPRMSEGFGPWPQGRVWNGLVFTVPGEELVQLLPVH